MLKTYSNMCSGLKALLGKFQFPAISEQSPDFIHLLPHWYQAGNLCGHMTKCLAFGVSQLFLQTLALPLVAICDLGLIPKHSEQMRPTALGC